MQWYNPSMPILRLGKPEHPNAGFAPDVLAPQPADLLNASAREAQIQAPQRLDADARG